MSLKLSIFTYSESKLSHVFATLFCTLMMYLRVARVATAATATSAASGGGAMLAITQNLNAFYDD